MTEFCREPDVRVPSILCARLKPCRVHDAPRAMARGCRGPVAWWRYDTNFIPGLSPAAIILPPIYITAPSRPEGTD